MWVRGPGCAVSHSRLVKAGPPKAQCALLPSPTPGTPLPPSLGAWLLLVLRAASLSSTVSLTAESTHTALSPTSIPEPPPLCSGTEARKPQNQVLAPARKPPARAVSVQVQAQLCTQWLLTSVCLPRSGPSQPSSNRGSFGCSSGTPGQVCAPPINILASLPPPPPPTLLGFTVAIRNVLEKPTETAQAS